MCCLLLIGFVLCSIFFCESRSAVKFTYTNSTEPTDTSIQSENYPGVYPVNSNVTWVWETGQGRWGVYFRDFDLSPNEDFTDGGDWLGIHSGRDGGGNIYTYSSHIESYVSKGSKLIVNFVSDSKKDGPTVRGFHLEIYYGNSEKEVRLKLHEAASRKPKDDDSSEAPSTIVILTIVFTILTAVLVAIICGLRLTRAKKAKANDDRDVFGVRRGSGVRHSRHGSSTSSPPQSPAQEGAPGQQPSRHTPRQATHMGWMARAELNNSLHTSRRDRNLEPNGHITQVVEQDHHDHHHYSNNMFHAPPDSHVGQQPPRITDGASAPSGSAFKEMRQVFDCVSDKVGQCRDTSHSFRFHGDPVRNTSHASSFHVSPQVPRSSDGASVPFREMRQVFECVSDKVGKCRDTSHSFRFPYDLDKKAFRGDEGSKGIGNAPSEKHANTYTAAITDRKSENTRRKQNFQAEADDQPEEESSGSGPPSYESLLQEDNAASASACAAIGYYDNVFDLQRSTRDAWPGRPPHIGVYTNAPTDSLESVSDVSISISSISGGIHQQQEQQQEDNLIVTQSAPPPCRVDDTAIYSLALPAFSINEHPPSPLSFERELGIVDTCSTDVHQPDSSQLRFVDGYAYIITQPPENKRGDFPSTTQQRTFTGAQGELCSLDVVPGSVSAPQPGIDMGYMEMSVVRNTLSSRAENIYTNDLTRPSAVDVTSEK